MDSSMAAIAAALNDRERAEIGDPRLGTYTVRLLASDIEEAHHLAKHLYQLAGAEVRTTIHYNQGGDPASIWVSLYDREGQETLLNRVRASQDPTRRKALEDLVRSRGPIPDSLLKRIWNAHQRYWDYHRIAEQMNALLDDDPEVIAGMGMRQWTAQKVAKAIKQYRATLDTTEEAA